MEIITNSKIEKQKADIVKTKEKIAEFQIKLREQEKNLRVLEDFEIVARFRSIHGNEELAEELKVKKKETADTSGKISTKEEKRGEEGKLETQEAQEIQETQANANFVKKEETNGNAERE